MKVKVIGGHGGTCPGFKNSSYLIDDVLLIDAGSVASGLTIKSQSQIDYILLSHSHLDHVSDLPFLLDNCFGMKGRPFEVYAHRDILSNVKKHIFNEVIWPDFSKIPNTENPTVTFNELMPEKEIKLGKYTVRGVEVNHMQGSMGYIINDGESTVILTQDTAETDRVWEYAKESENLKAIFTEISFPNRMQGIADASFHHTPQSFKKELQKLPLNVPVYVGHLKPSCSEEIIQEIKSHELDVHILSHDGVEFDF